MLLLLLNGKTNNFDDDFECSHKSIDSRQFSEKKSAAHFRAYMSSLPAIEYDELIIIPLSIANNFFPIIVYIALVRCTNNIASRPNKSREKEKKLNHLIIHFTVYKRTTSGACFSWNLNIFMCAFWTFFSSSPPSPLFLSSFIVQSLFFETFLPSWDHGPTELTSSSLVCLLCSFPLLLLTSSTHCLFFDSDAKSQRLPPPIWSQI